MEDLDLNIKEFSELCGIPYKTMQNYLYGTRSINEGNLKKISLRLKVNINWLLTSEGEMYQSSTTGLHLKKIDKLLNCLRTYWDTADEDEKIWMEVQLKKMFPECDE